MLSRYLICFEGGVVEVNRSGPMKRKMTMKTLSAVAWMREFSTSFDEKLPNESKLNLSPYLIKMYVYGL